MSPGAALAVLVVLAVACGGEASTTTTAGETAPVTAEAAPTTVGLMPEQTTTTLAAEDIPRCGDDAELIEVGAVVTGETPGGSENVYYCLELEDGISTLTVRLTGLTAAADLWVGHPDRATVESGGFLLWSSDLDDLADEEVIANRGGDRTLPAGSYYIEVTGYEEAASFTLESSTD